jgi:hypothetical protein
MVGHKPIASNNAATLAGVMARGATSGNGEARPGSRAFQAIGLSVVALGIAHILSVVLLYPDELLAFVGSGFGGLYNSPATETQAFWSVLFGVMVAAAGQLIWWSGRQARIISVVPGIIMTIVGAIGAWFVPIAPFWAAAALGILTILLVVIRRRAAR